MLLLYEKKFEDFFVDFRLASSRLENCHFFFNFETNFVMNVLRLQNSYPKYKKQFNALLISCHIFLSVAHKADFLL